MALPWLLDLVHLVALVLATWRLTDAILFDRIFAWLRDLAPPERYVGYLLRCPRCLSVWTGTLCTALWAVWPWALWPLALSWSYLWYATSRDDTSIL